MCYNYNINSKNNSKNNMQTTSNFFFQFLIPHLQFFKWNGTKNGGTSLCPFHKDTKPSFGVNFDKNIYHCFSCGAAGNLYKLSSHLGYAIQNELDVYKHYSKQKEENNKKTIDKIIQETALIKGNHLHDHLHAHKINTESPQYKEFLSEKDLVKKSDYLDARNIPEWAIYENEIRYSLSEQCIIFPLFNINKTIIGNFKRFELPQKKGIKCSFSNNFKTTSNIYGLWKYKGQKIAILSEGIIDSIRIEDYLRKLNLQDNIISLTTYSCTTFSKQQLNLLKNINIRTLIFFYDNDLAGKKGILQFKEKYLKKNKFKTLECFIPDFSLYPTHKKDPDELDLNEFNSLLQSIRQFKN